MKKLLLLIFMSVSLLAMPKFLMPDEAFIPKAELNEKMQIEAKIELAKDMYLYENKVKLEISSDLIEIKNIQSSKAVMHHEEMVYLDSPSFVIDLKKNSSFNDIKTVKLTLFYQGCSEQGLCYEPLEKSFDFDIDTSKLMMDKIQEEIIVKDISEVDAIADTIKSGNIIIILLTFFGFGFLLSLTPCVFPMIPIISGLIISQGKGITTKKAFFLSVVYVLAMAVAYTIAGVLAGLFGANLQVALQNPWVIYSFSAVFVALAMSMFGYYELKIPDYLVAKISSTSHSSGVVGVAIMGFLSALIVGPCVAAPLAGALVYIGQTGDAILGGMALFSMSIGMGIPLIVVGVSAGKLMPKPGAWMTMVSAIFGVMMLVVAVWMLERVVESYITMLLYSFLGLGFAIYIGVFEKDSHVFKKSVAVILFIYSVALLIGTLGGSDSMSKPLEFLKPQASQTILEVKKSKNNFITITSIEELNIELEKYKGKKILLDFTAKWCTACKELEEVTFADANVMVKMKDFVLIKADVTDNNQEQKDLSAKYGVFGPPALLFIDENSKVLNAKTIIGFIKPDAFLEHLHNIN
ncbi:MAG: protein-disulfide reductase DsbD [Campylobacterota bacterium]|nr:protein-disulfide reductase DsbD [Campylobacterota bacterium]